MARLEALRVVDLSTGIAGAYCTKLFADAGADVIKVETREGDPLRRWSATGADLNGEDGALFQFLHQNKRAVTGAPDDAGILELIAGADLVVENFAPGVIDELNLTERFPGLVLLSISPFGRGGPWTQHPASEFTIQAACGSIGGRGVPGQEPYVAGGRITDWMAGTYSAVASLAAVQRALRTGHGEHVDFSLMEVMTLAGTNFLYLFFKLVGAEIGDALAPGVETPSIEPTADGYVGFCTNTRQQFSDFLVMIDRVDLQQDEVLAQIGGRMGRLHEWNEVVHEWTRKHSTAEILEKASLLRIPVAPIHNGETVLENEQLASRGVFQADATGRFSHPRPPYRIDNQDPPAFRPAPGVGADDGNIESRTRQLSTPDGSPRLPLDGLKILDLTNWWAGPAASQMCALLGAEVIHVEGTVKPDGMRMMGGMLIGQYPDAWWECSHLFLSVNTNKKDVAINLTTERGRELLLELVAKSDVVIENFTPRVLEGFGITWDAIRAANPRAIFMQMPAFGLTGPWRDKPGFAQTMEQMTGMAWLTGHSDDQPRIQRGPCDPLAGMHGAFALLVALESREQTGRGSHVECTMVEGALQAASEQLIEFTAYGRLMQREGNRAPHAAPQGLYPCEGHELGVRDRWLALSVETDTQWGGLKQVLGRPAWSDEASLATHAGRREAQDRIDAELRAWFASRDRSEVIETLLAAGVPAAAVADPRCIQHNPQLLARGYFEDVEHPVVGVQPLPGAPFRYASVKRWLTGPAPTLGQHNREILSERLGLDESELERLEQDGIIGTRPDGI